MKEAPEDFVLWKSAKPLEPSWDSPWGYGSSEHQGPKLGEKKRQRDNTGIVLYCLD